MHLTQMNCLRLGPGGTALVAVILTLLLSAVAQPPPPSALMQSANTPLPSGPFASWAPESREPAIRGVQARCAFIGGMAFANYHGPKEAAGRDISAFISVCTVKEMPDDWPGREAEQQRAASRYEAAKQLDPNVPDPNLLASGLRH
jgi:hypothetical protein